MPAAGPRAAAGSASSSVSFSEQGLRRVLRVHDNRGARRAVLVAVGNVVRLDPAGRADREAVLGAAREHARRLDVAAQQRRLGGSEIGMAEIALAAIGDGELRIALGGFGLARE